jgi:serine/threonine protein kinase
LSDLLKSIKNNVKENFTNDFIKMRWSLELMRGLTFIHSKHVAHRDLKPSNVFLYENESKKISIKIGDFGLSKDMANVSCLKSFVGTFHYQSPQVIRGEAHTNKTDVW